MLSLLTLPFRLVFSILCGLIALPFALLAVPLALLYLPFLLLRLVFKAIVGLIVLPFVLVATVIGIGVALMALFFGLLLPAIVPIAIAAVCLWIVLRLASPTPTV